MSKTLTQVAYAELGVSEIVGKEHNHTILKYAEAIGLSWYDKDEIPWCGVFIGYCAKTAGLDVPKHPARARDWATVGQPIDIPRHGDVVVFKRGGGGHVGIFIGWVDAEKGSRMYLLGGNQSNKVSIGKYSTDNVLDYRRLGEASDGSIDVPKAPLKRGDDNHQVGNLQKVLNHLGFNCGIVDEDFGGKTKTALSLFQKANGLLPTGDYNARSEAKLFSLLNA